MKAYTTSSGDFMIALSRRNLLSLLAKLDGHPPNSACKLAIMLLGASTLLIVKAEEDSVHYRDRKPGPMHAATEAVLKGE